MAGRWNPQVQGRRNYNNRTSDLIIRSYSQLGVFPHNYHVGTGHQRRICKSHPQRINAEVVDSEVDEEAGDNSSDDNDVNYGGPDLFARKNGVTALTFDTKGKYLAAGTRRGCLTVYNFESLYGHIRFRAQEEEDELMQLSHVTTDMRQINSIRWNPADQNEIACGSRRFHNLHIYDCYAPTEPPKIKCKRRADHKIEDWMPGLSDVAFASTNESCIVASDFHYPTVAVWDTRENNGLPVRQLRLNHNGREATCVQYSEYGSDQHVVGGGTGGFVYLWDLRVADIPLQEWSVFDLMEGQHLTVGYNGRDAHNIYSIDFNPVNHGQLAFHLDNGWSGVIDFQSSSISHIHRPLARPALEEVCRDPFCIRRCSWFFNSIYMAPSRNRRGIFLLDFHPSRSSPYHVNSVWNNDDNHRGLIELSEAVITSAAHPFYDMIVAGTENTSLLVISQKAESVKGVEVAYPVEQVANPVEQVANVVAEGANGDGEVNDEVEDAEMSDEDEDEEVTDEDEDEDEDE